MYLLGLVLSAATGLALGLVGGGVFGTVLSRRLAAHRLQTLFACLILTVAVFPFAKNYAVLF